MVPEGVGHKSVSLGRGRENCSFDVWRIGSCEREGDGKVS